MPEPTVSREHQTGSAATRAVIIVTLLAVVGGLVWYAGSRIKELNREMAASEKRAEEMNERLRQNSEELKVALDRARAQRSRAEWAEEQVEQTTEALEEAEHEVESVTAERERARQEVTEARAETAATRGELETIRQRREAELNRMQEALNRIAPTKRTPAGMVMMLSERDFRFAFDKAALTAKNRETLSRIAGILLASEGYRLFIDGHTDDQGDAAYNQGLSERRASAVSDYLVEAGIPPELVAVHGFGQRQPLVKAKTREARALNRRVEIGIVDTIIEYEKPARN